MENLKKLIRNIPDFPKEGILFRDITTLLEDSEAFKKVVEIFKANIPAEATKLAAVESRGFIFGGAISFSLGLGFIPIRKCGKLPWKTKKADYGLEYGTDTLEIHEDALKPGEKVVLIDDLLATGGTALASSKLIEQCGGKVAKMLFLIELDDLGGAKKLEKYDIFSIIHF